MEANWYPKDIPHSSSGNEIEINCLYKNEQKIFTEAILSTYKIIDDSKKLKQDSTTFEKQRGEYPIRREFTDYSVKLNNCNDEIADKLSKLGFKVILDK
jgi:erythronate-4-phosphate dehydrogenase